ncbi:Uncharacterised protein [Mycobacteroides abscessus subsp. massiliense]|uniref:Uncharacterized protein n=2 Tax=Mycobacteroides immunogenum TaxID=83262 RepID=A0A7V8RUU7_9MYCO|nr:hypothetical protein TL11_23555 [Mycobacteroides immunogenum]CPV42482.1 Uncharacterised protein [Mycobacteroides abscessus]SLD15028.1 Uncharacterised protein [Mycobacteroides abscessus subsp. massiliense]KPG05290.1 hypothetical protein AN908_22915 [Mycobacteroides immunogenum]KPG19376.1 hypothetical protein AN911_22970 [Mycobacteroides immunogenum]
MAMRLENVARASARFRWVYIKVDGLHIPAPPLDPAPVHAVRMYRPGVEDGSALERIFASTRALLERAASGREPYIDESWTSPFTAACGARVKVVWPGRFDDADPDRCVRCIEDLNLEKIDIAEWHRRHAARDNARWNRDQEHLDYLEWRERQRLQAWETEHPEAEEEGNGPA